MINYEIEFINFFKKYGLYKKEIFDYIEKKTELIGLHNIEVNNQRGIYYYYDKQKKLAGIKLLIEPIRNAKGALMNIRPYIQAIHAYYYIGQKYQPNVECEALAIYYERLFLQENYEKELEIYLNNIYKAIREEECETKYKSALYLQDKLDEYTQKNNPKFEDLKEKARKLSRNTKANK